MKRVLLLASLTALSAMAQKYTGPRPPKPDVPYLLHASNLVETEVATATEEKRKDDLVAAVNGTTSPARTPLAEPIFILAPQKLSPEKLECYKLEVRNGRREVVFPQKKRRDAPRPIILAISRLADGLYRVEVNQTLENGEYCLSPSGSNQVFCFTVY